MLLVALAFVAFAASALAGSFATSGAFQINGSIAATDPLTRGYLLTTASSCGGEAPSTIVSDPGLGYHYKAYTFRNISKSVQCVNVSLSVSASSEAAARVSAHRGSSFEASNPLARLLADDSNGAIPGAVSGMSFTVPCHYCASGPDTFVVVVREDSRNIRPAYRLLVEGAGIVMTGGTATALLQSFRATSVPAGVVVRWRTRSERGALGFNLYRGDQKHVRLTRTLVRASGRGRGRSYSYVDRTARKGEPGRYWLEVVLRGGSRIMFGPALIADQ